MLLALLLAMATLGVSGMNPIVKTACRGTSGLTCTALELECKKKQRIFLVSAEYGYTRSDTGCLWIVSDCRNASACCRDDRNACYQPYGDADFSKLFDSCWNKSSCKHNVDSFQTGKETCSADYSTIASFSRVRYFCLDDKQIFADHSRKIPKSKELVLRYTLPTSNDVTSGNDSIWSCDVDDDDEAVEVTLLAVGEVLEPSFSQHCLFLDQDPCNRATCSHQSRVTYASDVMKTPFNVSLRARLSKAQPSGWMLLWAQEKLVVTCRLIWESTLCAGRRGLSTIRPITPGQRTSSASSVTPPESSSAGVDRREITTNGSQQMKTRASDVTGGVVGGVVGGVAALVAIAVGVVCLLRRRRSRTASEGKALVSEWSSGRSSLPTVQAISTAGQEALDCEEGNVYVEILDSQLTGDGGVEDTGYDRLGGEKPTSGGNPYCHLSSAPSDLTRPEVMECGYDHLTRGDQSTSSVINAYSDASVVAVASDNDHRVVTGSDYDVPKPVVTSDNDGDIADSSEDPHPYFTVYDAGSGVVAPGGSVSADSTGGEDAALHGANYEVAKPILSPALNVNYEVAKPIT